MTAELLGYVGIALIVLSLIGMVVLFVRAPLREDLGVIDEDLHRRGL